MRTVTVLTLSLTVAYGIAKKKKDWKETKRLKSSIAAI